MANIEVIRIGEDEIHGVRDEQGDCWVALLRACEVLGLDSEGQRQKLSRLDWACTFMMKAHDASGREQELFCLHKDSVPMWLATVDPGRCNPRIVDKVKRWQRDAAKALAEWAYGRRPTQPAALDLRDPAALQRLALQLTGIVQEQQAQIQELTPPAQAWRALGETTGNVCIQDAAKALSLNPILFHRWLEQHGDIFRRGRSVHAAQVHLDAGRMVERNVVVGEQRFTQVRITSKGVGYWGERRPDLTGVRVRRLLPQRAEH